MKSCRIIIFIATVLVVLFKFAQTSDVSEDGGGTAVSNKHAGPGCFNNSDCDRTEFCKNGKCIDGCNFLKCSREQYCTIKEHVPKCHCRAGDHIAVELCDGHCDVDFECHPDESCKDNQCTTR